MKIGFDISQTGKNKAGCGYFADSLIRALVELDRENEYILYPCFGTTFWDPEAAHATCRIEHPRVTRKQITKDYGKSMSFWRDLPADAEERLGGPDIIHSNNFSCPSGLKGSRIVYTLHDLGFLEYPEFTTEENRCKCFEGVFAAAVGADFIVAASRYSSDKFLEFFPHYPQDRIQVVYEGSRFLGVQKDFELGKKLDRLSREKFWLAVGTLEPRKNLRRLLRAFAFYRRQVRKGYPLVLAGGKGWLEEDLEGFIHKLGLSEDVYILGYVSDEELAWLYGNCYAFVYPSLYEGFGLPVLEAMEFGAAAIVSRTTSLPEVAGMAAFYIDPFDENDIACAFQELSVNRQYRRELKNRAKIRATEFSWEKTAAVVLNVYERVSTRPKFENNSD